MNLVVEDALSEIILRKIIKETGKPFIVESVYGREGIGYIKKRIKGFNFAARVRPIFVLVDLDQIECTPKLLNRYLRFPRNHNLIFRVAEKEVEAWILADIESFSNFIKRPMIRIPDKTDQIQNPKQFLIRQVEKSRIRSIRDEIVPDNRSTAKIGPNYNYQLQFFIEKYWRIDVAIKYSESLRKAFVALKNYDFKNHI